ncbi:FtsX-like permease family protein [Rhodocyclaceae bacterium SMB388]
MIGALLRVFVASLFGRRLASVLSLLAVTLGVALGLAVQIIHGAALDEFGRGMRLLAGEADLQVVGPRTGFDDRLYLEFAQRPDVAEASPVLEIEARLPGREDSLRIYGVDLFRVARVLPLLMPVAEAGDGRLLALEPGRVFLSAAARRTLGLAVGDPLVVQSGLRETELVVSGAVPGAAEGQALAVMDIAAAQQIFDRIGVLSRIDLRLASGIAREDARQGIGAWLPPGIEARLPEAGIAETSGLSRAYRVNLTMLAAIALLTGAFLVFSTQYLSVVRRSRELAFLRAMGMERHLVMRGLLLEGAALGLVGGLLGIALAHGLAALAFSLVGGDLGAGYFAHVTPSARFMPGASLVYLVLGVAAGVAGAWLPARHAASQQPAQGLRAGNERDLLAARPRWRATALCLVFGLLACVPGPVGGIPVFGYVAVALVLAAAVLALPGVVGLLAAPLRLSPGVLARLALARVTAAPGQVVVAGAGVVASVALAVSMAIMVGSFRDSVDDWLSKVLPSDLYVRASSSAASGFLDEEAVARVAAIEGVAEVVPVRYDALRVGDSPLAVTLIARPTAGGDDLPVVSRGTPPQGELPWVWITEAMADLHRLAVGDRVALPIAGREASFVVAGVTRDYARQHGAVIVELDDYRRLSGDRLTNDLGVQLKSGADVDEVVRRVREALGERVVEISLPSQIRAISLEIFDRTFLVTYLMQAVAVLIGLFGISTTFAALATSRSKEFGMLRHLGLRRGDIGRLLALEGSVTAAVGVMIGTLAGGAIALVLVEVINRQSFHWSMDLALPLGPILAFAATLVALAAVAARLSGAQAMRGSAVAAVREDW